MVIELKGVPFKPEHLGQLGSYLTSVGRQIYPKTDTFHQALPVFEFLKSSGLRLWVLPFCLKNKRLLLPPCGGLDALFSNDPQPRLGDRPEGSLLIP